ncbi:helix-turn-helix transcriptional regulator, partial [Humibacter sp.]|uniref:helix-turn-helix domain-containing protein n=1 Tax=Humibacter sp. TaxID=1940291 RepID=UPI002B5DF065
MNVRVPIQGDTLRWARELAWFDTVEVGKAAGVSAAQVEAFEAGEVEPTYRQLTLLSKKLDRPP